jgi:hemoglobin
MAFRRIFAVGLVGTACAVLGACGSDSSSNKPVEEPLYYRLGGAPAVQAVVGDFLTRVKADPKINGYFLNASLDAQHLSDCLVKQIGEATGGPEKYDCKSMKAAHADLGISKQDFDDLVGHLTDALTAAKVDAKDIDTIAGVLLPMESDIVTDGSNDKTIYQRIGRKPAIQAVITDFHARVAADTAINSFFATTDANRLATCLVRQVCMATGGPCKYGDEIPDAEPGVKSACRPMKDSHVGLNIAYADFQQLVSDLVAALDAAKVPADDKNAILSALAPMCSDIVEKDTCQ